MSILSYDSFWNAVITLPMTKKMLQMSLKKCGGCGRTVLEAALDDYAGKTDRHCDKCSGLYSQVIGFWIEFLRRALGFKRAKVNSKLEMFHPDGTSPNSSLSKIVVKLKFCIRFQ